MSQSPQRHDVFRFGVFELDARSGELRKSGVKLRLPGQPVQVLVELPRLPLIAHRYFSSRLTRAAYLGCGSSTACPESACDANSKIRPSSSLL